MKYTNLLLFISFFSFFSCTDYQDNTTEDETNKTSNFRPNVVWITAEDLSPRWGCFGDSVAQTPNIDALCKESVKYTNVFSISGVCAPSRHALITGMYPTTNGAQHMRNHKFTSAISKVKDKKAKLRPLYEAVPPANVKCFSELLRANGYYTTNHTKTDYQFHTPLTAWDDTKKSAHWRNRPKGKPFFSVFNLTITHESRVWMNNDCTLITDPEKVVLPPYYPDTKIIRHDMAVHYDNVSKFDQQVGEIINQLKEDNLLDSTIIFIYTDHGDGLPRMKRWLYDSGIKVPMIVRYPGMKDAGKVDERLISFIDFAPTMLSIIGSKIPDYMPGIPFTGYASSDSIRPYIFAAKDRMGTKLDNSRAVRSKQYKYIKNYYPAKPYVQTIAYRDQMNLMQELYRTFKSGEMNETQLLWFAKTKPEEELYDITKDPHEINNLAGDPSYQEVLDELRIQHYKWAEETQDYGTMPESELVKKLWSPDGVQPMTEKPQISKINKVNGEISSIELESTTEGASIAYRFTSDTTWSLYTDGVLIKKEAGPLHAIANRIGFKPSELYEFDPEN